ncbi:hypothetical protein F444_09624, partial [Phytophthora nicotianae P1976]
RSHAVRCCCRSPLLRPLLEGRLATFVSVSRLSSSWLGLSCLVLQAAAVAVERPQLPPSGARRQGANLFAPARRSAVPHCILLTAESHTSKSLRLDRSAHPQFPPFSAAARLLRRSRILAQPLCATHQLVRQVPYQPCYKTLGVAYEISQNTNYSHADFWSQVSTSTNDSCCDSHVLL